MIKNVKRERCFQCGSDLIVVKIYKEIINHSEVTTTKSICSDTACQKRTKEYLRMERARIEESLKSRESFFNPRNSGSKKKETI